MLRSLKDLENYAIGATDGNVGHVKDFYFDDDYWVVRYLVVETGEWLASRKVLISPVAIHNPDWAAKALPVSITREQVQKSPGIDSDKPVSRQYEQEYMGYYGYPYYWGGTGFWGDDYYPNALPAGSTGDVPGWRLRAAAAEAHARDEQERHRNDDPHLRSAKAVIGYHIEATDGDIGHVQGILVDEQTWAIRYLVVDTSNWWGGHTVLIAPPWIKNVRWTDSTVSVHLNRQAVKDAPAYDSTAELNRQREIGLYQHYGRTGYWSDEDQRESELAAL